MKFVFSVVSHGHRDEVRQLLDSLAQKVMLGSHSLRVIVTNNLPDADWEFQSEKFSVRTIHNLRPKGFGENHNTAFSVEECDVFCVVNPDIIFIENFYFEKVADALMANEAVSPVILETDLRVADFRRRDLSLRNLILRRFGMGDVSEPEDFEWLAGMFLCFPKDWFQKIKGFDTRYFMYVEDCDICRSVVKQGGTLGVISEMRVCHQAKRQSRKSIKHMRWHLTSLIKYWLKMGV